MSFNLVSEYQPEGDQPQAIKSLVENFRDNVERQVLLGVTGSGKTFTMANVIKQLNVPTLIIAHNKTLAAQLYGEFKSFFPESAVEYFVSYYDYYQPEAYIPSKDMYIEKDSAINDQIEKFRYSSTISLLERRDVIIVASVSCIYGLGTPEAYYGLLVSLEIGETVDINTIVDKLLEIKYDRNNFDLKTGIFRLKGDVLEVFPSHTDNIAYRIEFFDNEVDRISEIDPLTGKTLKVRDKVAIYPNTHYVKPPNSTENAIKLMKKDLLEVTSKMHSENRLIEEQRLTQRTMFDIEMIQETGYVKGIENYSRYFENREPGEPAPTLLSYLPSDALVIVDESHMTIPQVRGMYEGDKSRKTQLVEYGFRLPSALDNRPLKFEEFDSQVKKIMYVSATPADYEVEDSKGIVVEQVIRPTGLIDPPIEIRPADTQVDDLFGEIDRVVKAKGRVLVTTLTKRMAEQLTDYYKDLGVKVEYMHSGIDTLERIKIIGDLREGVFDVLVGINLLREGLDIPEVHLVAILDADKEGFLRSERALIQTVGRAARNIDSRAIFYANKMTKSMQKAIDETNRRRLKQTEYNKQHNITPTSIKSSFKNILASVYEKDYFTVDLYNDVGYAITGNKKQDIKQLEKIMFDAAKKKNYEKAAKCRDLILELKSKGK